MRKHLLAFSLITCSALAFGQARLVLNNDAWLRIDGGAWVVVENPATNAITTLGTGGNISSEAETDRLRWQIGNATGAYTIPFTASPSNVKIPMIMNIGTAGTATGSVVFSTYNYGTAPLPWDNNSYRPSDVTHMNNYTTGNGLTPGVTNESGHVVDRFWIIDTKAVGYAYTTSPVSVLTFRYPQTEVMAGNTITNATPLDVQRFNNLTNRWGDQLFSSTFTFGSPSPGINTVVSPSIAATSFFRSWTLSDKNNPLPIELTDFRAECDGDQVLVKWTTASEQDNDYFLIEKSADAITYEVIGSVDGAGNSVETINYAFADVVPSGLAYYRLTQVDFDGQNSTSDVVAAGCDADGGIEIVNAWDDGENVQVVMNSSLPGNFDLTLVDAQGKVVFMRPEQNVNGGGISMFNIPKGALGMGMYVIRLTNDDRSLSRKIVLN